MTVENSAGEWVPLTSLRAWDQNPRKNKDAIQKVADSIRRFGFGAPIVARKENGEIIAGHTRFFAAKALGMKSAPVRYLDISEHDAHLLALADNKLGEIAEWDDAKLGEILSGASFADAMTAGWSGDDIGKMADAIIGEPMNLEDATQMASGLKYCVIVDCANEGEQADLMTRFEQEGLSCRPLIS